MSITDELRAFFDGADGYELWCPHHKKELTMIADRIDAAHQKATDEWKAKDGQAWLRGYAECHAELMEGNEAIAADLEKAGWLRLPKDADGKAICVGDEVEYLDEPHVCRVVTSIDLAHNGWWVYVGGTGRRPDKYRHHHEPTVEDVLREFAEKITDSQIPNVHPTYEEAIAEYATKLRLAGEDA